MPTGLAASGSVGKTRAVVRADAWRVRKSIANVGSRVESPQRGASGRRMRGRIAGDIKGSEASPRSQRRSAFSDGVPQLPCRSCPRSVRERGEPQEEGDFGHVQRVQDLRRTHEPTGLDRQLPGASHLHIKAHERHEWLVSGQPLHCLRQMGATQRCKQRGLNDSAEKPAIRRTGKAVPPTAGSRACQKRKYASAVTPRSPWLHRSSGSPAATKTRAAKRPRSFKSGCHPGSRVNFRWRGVTGLTTSLAPGLLRRHVRTPVPMSRAAR